MRLALVSLLVLVLGVPDAHAKSAADVLKELNAYYAKVEHSTAAFEQRFDNVTFGTTETSEGEVRVEKPGKMRWDYWNKGTQDPRKTFMTDGKVFWLLDHQSFEATKLSISGSMLPVAVTFLYGKGNLSADFNVALDASGTYAASGHDVLELTPKQPSATYKRLYLVVASGGRVAKSVVIDSAGNANHYEFRKPNTKDDIKDSLFVFKPKSKAGKKYRVVGAGKPKVKTKKPTGKKI